MSSFGYSYESNFDRLQFFNWRISRFGKKLSSSILPSFNFFFRIRILFLYNYADGLFQNRLFKTVCGFALQVFNTRINFSIKKFGSKSDFENYRFFTILSHKFVSDLSRFWLYSDGIFNSPFVLTGFFGSFFKYFRFVNEDAYALFGSSIFASFWMDFFDWPFAIVCDVFIKCVPKLFLFYSTSTIIRQFQISFMPICDFDIPWQMFDSFYFLNFFKVILVENFF